MFLADIVESHQKAHVDLLAQELPLKKPGSFQSTTMDYILFRHDEQGRDGAWIFLELKTDSRSVRGVQDQIYADILDTASPSARRPDALGERGCFSSPSHP